MTVGGQTAASLKQYYSRSCNEYFSYLWVWDSFRASHSGWTVTLQECGPVGASNLNCVDTPPWNNTSQQEFWSNPGYSGCGDHFAAVRFLYNQYNVPQSTEFTRVC